MHAVICILEFMSYMLFLIKSIKFKQLNKVQKVRTSQLCKIQAMLGRIQLNV